MTTEPAVPEDRKYTPTHEWVKTEGDELVIGITDHAQSELTDVVFVDLPPIGRETTALASVLVIESVKTVADVYAPAAGRISQVNTELKTHPELINQDPYGKGWIFRLKPSAPPDLSGLLDAAGYRAAVERAV
ncbi:MAG: glycine cleavage system protein GcvH [Thermoplasmata archaeon]